MRGLIICAVMSLAAVSLAAKAEDQQTPQPSPATTGAAAAPATPDAGDKLICRNEQVTGSHFPQKVCMTQHDWDMAQDRSHSEIKRTETNALQMRPGGG